MNWSTAISASSVSAGNVFGSQPVVLLTDYYGDGINDTLVTLSLYSDSGCSNAALSANMSGNTAVTNSSGYATIAGFKATKVGTYYVEASAVGLNSTCSTAALNVTQGDLTTLSFITHPSGTATAGIAFNIQPLLLGVDLYVNAAGSIDVTLSAFTNIGCTNAASGTLTNPTQSTNGTGYVSFSTSTWLSTIAGQTIYFKATSGSATVISTGSINVIAAPLSKLAFVSQPSGTAIAGAVFASQPVIYGTDAYNNFISSSVVALSTFTDSACTIVGARSLLNNSRTANATGYTTFDYLSYNLAQTIYLKASSGNFLLFQFELTFDY